MADRRTGVACTYQFFKTKKVKIHRKIFKEIALKWIVAITEYNFISKILPVVSEFIFDDIQLSIKLINLGLICLMKDCISVGYGAS